MKEFTAHDRFLPMSADQVRQWWEREIREPHYLWVPGRTMTVTGTAAEPVIEQDWERREL